MINVSARSLWGSVGVGLALALVWGAWLAGAAPALAGTDTTDNSRTPLQYSSLNRDPHGGAAALASDSGFQHSSPQGGRFAVSQQDHFDYSSLRRVPATDMPSDTPAVPQGVPPAWWETVQAYIHADVAASLPPLEADSTPAGFVSGLSERGTADGFAASSATGVGATPALMLTGEATGNFFGFSVASAGDVNGDGYADLLVGAYFYNSQQGRAYLYLGSGSGLSATPALTLTGEAGSSQFGISVASAGDVNGDGYADLVVGAAGHNGNQGRAYLYLGSGSGLSATPALTLTGEAGSSQFGISVASAGDVNGDGYADLLVGAYLYNSGQGRAYLYLGSGSGLGATPALTFTGEATGDQYGLSVASAGDVNGDGYADLVVGARGYNSSQGRAYLYMGNESAGVALKPRLRRTDDSAPIANGGKSDSASFRIAALGRTPFGRGKVKLEWEVKPLGTAFNGSGTYSGTTWLDTGTAGVALNELLSNLSPNTAYHWRVRLRYHPAGSPAWASASRWLTQPWNGWNETDVRTRPRQLFLPLVVR